MNTSSYMIDSLAFLATKNLSASGDVFIACDQSAGTNQIAYIHVKFFAIQAGTLKDTLLE